MMADNQKYYYMRLKDDFFDDDAIKLIEAMPDGYLYSNILLKLYLKSLKFGGKLMFNERIPYNPQALATVTAHSIGTVEKALEIFQEMGLIEIFDNGTIYMMDLQALVGKSSTEADRKREYRAKIEEEKTKLAGHIDGQISSERRPNVHERIEIRDRDRDRNRDKDKERHREQIDYQKIVNYYNETCVSFPRIRSLSESRKKAIKARINSGYTSNDFCELFRMAEASLFLRGNNTRNWSATFDWLIKDSNMAKVLEGNYENRGETDGKHRGNNQEKSRDEPPGIKRY